MFRSAIPGSLGKTGSPFGPRRTVNPCTASCVRYPFGGLPNGYGSEGPSLTVTAFRGGGRFRAANPPARGPNRPGRVEDFALNPGRGSRPSRRGRLPVGGSYLRGAGHCRALPVAGFTPCRDRAAEFGICGEPVPSDPTLEGALVRTLHERPGAFDLGKPEFQAGEVTALGVARGTGSTSMVRQGSPLASPASSPGPTARRRNVGTGPSRAPLGSSRRA